MALMSISTQIVLWILLVCVNSRVCRDEYVRELLRLPRACFFSAAAAAAAGFVIYIVYNYGTLFSE